MKTSIFKSFLVLSLALAGGFLAVPPSAMAAYINISPSGNTLSISVSGANYGETVDLVYTLPGSSMPTTISNIGYAYGGNWNGSLNLNEYGIVSGSQVYVKVGGQQSNAITVGSGYYGGCTYNCGTPYSLSLSQTNVSLSVGQSTTVTAYNYGNSIYISSNSNSNIVSASVSGGQISLYGLASGSSTISVCGNSSYYGSGSYYGQACASIYVNVVYSGSGSGNSGSVWFSPSSPTMYVGQSLAVSINSSTAYSSYYYGSNAYYVSSNSNPAAVSASVSGTTLNLYAYQNGSSSINVCHSSLGFCGTLYVTVYGSGSGGSISFSENNVNLTLGQGRYINIYNTSSGSSSYYISSNSNPSAVTASISGSQIYLYGQNSGYATLSVCPSGYSGACASLYATVSGGSTGGVTFSPSSPTLYTGQSLSVSLYGGGSYNGYYISSQSNPSAVTASVSGNTLSLYGKSQGSSSITVCNSGYSSCSTLYVSVSGTGYSGSLSLSQYSLSLTSGQTSAVNIYGGGTYYISSNSNSSVASASVSGSSLTVYANSAGSTTISVCQNYASQCANLYVTVSGGVLGASTYKNGQLLKEGGTIYIVYRNSKTGFANFPAFSGFGFSLSNVLDAGYVSIPSSGYVISTSNASHPWGSWIKSGNTVYFAHEQGLIPVPDWNTFLNNGGQANLIVNSNQYDFYVPMLSPMTWNDSRLF